MHAIVMTAPQTKNMQECAFTSCTLLTSREFSLHHLVDLRQVLALLCPASSNQAPHRPRELLAQLSQNFRRSSSMKASSGRARGRHRTVLPNPLDYHASSQDHTVTVHQIAETIHSRCVD
eukprot:CAMPEP_0203881402 /NCGR_PEP_ID=MMETSP0359-20131031/25693_1 /ASSEMBLY_ACC=CAM_ASM_000338 /TAXON_ID=268821 /ORGANISM="Scrippsiella Hangoei, Strain SHTV-5" /LENGTH=119 /DNA_ID=CAMNT_0050801215 /DNA_START=269 /DNA_END=625 /DNA_ORIENTATION=-